MKTKQNLPKPNLPLLRKVLDHIDAHPETWEHDYWALRSERGVTLSPAGLAVVLSGDELVWSIHHLGKTATTVRIDDGSLRLIRTRARELLGLTKLEAALFFHAKTTQEELHFIAKNIAMRIGRPLYFKPFNQLWLIQVPVTDRTSAYGFWNHFQHNYTGKGAVGGIANLDEGTASYGCYSTRKNALKILAEIQELWPEAVIIRAPGHGLDENYYKGDDHSGWSWR